MKKIVLTVCLLLAIAGTVSASGYYNGYVEDGYSYNNGYWYLNGQGYTRERYWQPGYYKYAGCNSCWVNGYYFYKYYPYYPPQQQLPSYNDPGWRTKLLDIAAARDKNEAKLREKGLDHAQYMEAVAALGLQGNFRIQGYGQVVPYGAQASYGLYGVQGTTTYGYSQQYFRDQGATYQSINLQGYLDKDDALLLQQYAQIVDRAQNVGPVALDGLQKTLVINGQNRNRVAETLAKGQALAMVIPQIAKAMALEPSSESKSFTFRRVEGPNGAMIQRNENPAAPPTPQVKQQLRERFQTLADLKCGGCHNDKDAKGRSELFKDGFKIGDYFLLNDVQKNKVWEVISSTDPKKMMPQGEDGKPAVPLTDEEKRLFFLN